MFPDLKTILQSYSDQISLVLAQNIYIYISWYIYPDIYIRNRIKSSEVNPHTYSQLNYDKGGKNIQWKKDNLFNKLCWGNCNNEIRTISNTTQNINSKWIKVLNIRLIAIKLIKENIGRTLWHKLQQYLFWFPSQSNENKTKQMGPE